MRARFAVHLILTLGLFMAQAELLRADDQCSLIFNAEVAKPAQRLSVRDQGCNGACDWFATVSLVEENIYRERNEIVNLSTEALLAKQLTKRALDYLDRKLDHFPEDAISSALRIFKTLDKEKTYVMESDWVVSDNYKNNGVETFRLGVETILNSGTSKEEQTSNIHKLARDIFGYKKDEAKPEYDPKLEFVGVVVRDRFAHYDKPTTYDRLVPVMSFRRQATKSGIIDILDKRLAEGRPVEVGLYWDNEGERRSSGKLKLPSMFKTYDKSDHAVLVYKKDWLGNYHAINSWGKGVGKDGHYVISGKYMKKAIFTIDLVFSEKDLKEKIDQWAKDGYPH